MDEIFIDNGGYIVVNTTYTSSDTWTKPVDTGIVGIEVWGVGGSAAGDANWGGSGGNAAGGSGIFPIPGLKLWEPKPVDMPIIYYDVTPDDVEEKGWEKSKPVTPINPKSRKKILFD